VSCAITPLPAGAAEPLAVLHAGCFPEDRWDAEALGRILGLSGGFGFVACQGDMPVGFALARDLGNEGEMLRAGIDEAARRELPSIVLEVADDNAAARGLYASAGFVAVGRRPRYYRRGGETIDALLLRCPVNREPRPI
jgi:[ribosomal protein S18]-alanine N-acetyltransferase